MSVLSHYQVPDIKMSAWEFRSEVSAHAFYALRHPQSDLKMFVIQLLMISDRTEGLDKTTFNIIYNLIYFVCPHSTLVPVVF